MRKFLSAAAIVFTLAGAAQAQDFDKGWDAYDAGDYATALQEFRPLAEQGDAIAQFYLGLFYRVGKGVPQHFKEAVKWYRKAAVQGNASAQNSLARRYQLGEGVPQDIVLAHMWYNIGNANGNELAAKNRGNIAKLMSARQIAEAQSLARECMASDYKNCGY
jgi:TPR repeat protein